MRTDAIHHFIVTEILNDDSLQIATDQDLLLSEMLDSLGVMRLVAHLEEQTGRSIPPEDVTLENFRTLNAIAHYLEARSS